jgi:hypothetical protein
MNGISLTTWTDAQLDARWRELQKESARTQDAAVLESNARGMAQIIAEKERRRAAREMEITR